VDRLAAMATFVRVVDSGSLSGAARSMPTSLTSVSRQIAALEEHYGTPLIVRTTRRLSLTDDGRLLYERAKAVLGELKDIEMSLSSSHRHPSGRLRISAPTLMGHFGAVTHGEISRGILTADEQGVIVTLRPSVTLRPYRAEGLSRIRRRKAEQR